MGKSQPELAKSEWALMDALWARGRGTASDLQADVQARQGWAYSTVKTMLDRLVDKGFVRSRRVGNVYEYMPRIRRQDVVSRVLDEFVERVLEGSAAPFMSRLVARHGLTADEVTELRSLLDQYPEDGACEEEGVSQ